MAGPHVPFLSEGLFLGEGALERVPLFQLSAILLLLLLPRFHPWPPSPMMLGKFADFLLPETP